MSATLRFDKIYPGLGRLRRSSGTDQRRVFQALNIMLDALYAGAHLGILRQIRDGQLAPLVVLDAFRRRRLEELPAAAEAPRGLATGLAAWRAAGAWSPAHAENLRQGEKRLLAGLAPDATVAHLPARLLEMRQQMAGTARAFNITRTLALAFLRDTETKASPLYRSVQALPALPVRPKMPHRPQTPANLAAIADAEVRAVAVSMAASGMGPKEFWEDGWERRGTALYVHGQKLGPRGGRERWVPDIGLVQAPRLTRGAFRQRLRAAGLAFTPYDLRRSFVNWLEAAHVPRTRRRLYMGHHAGDITDLYEQHEVTAFLAEDADRLRAWYAAQLPPG